MSRARTTALLALATCAAAGCGRAGRAEVARVPAPSGDVEAVLIETNGGATTSFGYLVHVVEPGDEANGEPAAWLSGAVRSDRAYGVNLRWEDDHTLAVEYLSARDTRPQDAPTTVAGRAVRVVLRDGIADAEAPPGGMEYNLRGRPLDAHPRVHEVRTAPGVSLEVFDWGGRRTPLVFLAGGGGHTARASTRTSRRRSRASSGHPGTTVVRFPGGKHYVVLAEADEARRLIADFARGIGR